MKKYLFTARGFIGARMFEPGQTGYAGDDVIPGAHMILQDDLVEVALPPAAPPAEAPAEGVGEPAPEGDDGTTAESPVGDAPTAE